MLLFQEINFLNIVFPRGELSVMSIKRSKLSPFSSTLHLIWVGRDSSVTNPLPVINCYSVGLLVPPVYVRNCIKHKTQELQNSSTDQKNFAPKCMIICWLQPTSFLQTSYSPDSTERRVIAVQWHKLVRKSLSALEVLKVEENGKYKHSGKQKARIKQGWTSWSCSCTAVANIEVSKGGDVAQYHFMTLGLDRFRCETVQLRKLFTS